MTDTATIDTNVSANRLQVDVQLVLDEQDYAEAEEPPSSEQLSAWANVAYAMLDVPEQPEMSEITIRLVESTEIAALNRDYRHQDKPTNVLSFPFEPFESLDSNNELDYVLLGDIVICHSIIVDEAQQQRKTVHNHYAHMVTHGLLHLCGFDHQEEHPAKQMEALEVKVLAQLAISNPYNES